MEFSFFPTFAGILPGEYILFCVSHICVLASFCAVSHCEFRKICIILRDLSVSEHKISRSFFLVSGTKKYRPIRVCHRLTHISVRTYSIRSKFDKMYSFSNQYSMSL